MNLRSQKLLRKNWRNFTTTLNIESLSPSENILRPIIITFPLFITVHYYHRPHTIILPLLLSRQICSKIILPSSFCLVLWRDERLGERALIFSHGTHVAQQRPRKGPHFSSEGVSPRKIRLPTLSFLALSFLSLSCFYIITSIK